LLKAKSDFTSALLGVRTHDELPGSPLAGAVWETVVASELRRSLLNAGYVGAMFFWRERDHEVDFVIHVEAIPLRDVCRLME